MEKHVNDNHFWLTEVVGTGVKIEWNKRREEVCERVITGKKVIPAEPEKTITVPAQPEREVEIFEWKCPDSILAALKEPRHASEELPLDPGPPLTMTPAFVEASEIEAGRVVAPANMPFEPPF